MHSLPNDVLFIHYTELAKTPEERLHTLSLIGLLLNYSEDKNIVLEEDQLILYAWLEQGNGKLFWRVESDKIQVQQECKKHVLIGTNQLISDLGKLKQKNQLEEQNSLESIWNAARQYVIEELPRK